MFGGGVVNERMFPWKLLLVLVAALALAGSSLAVAGCAGSGVTTTTQAGAATTTAAAQSAATTADTRPMVTITDEAGRTLTVPSPIKSVYCTSPMGTNLMYTLAPDMLVGWNITPTALEQKYIPEQYRSVVGLGGWFGKNTTGNVEEIIKRHPDVVISLGTLDSGAISDADRIQGLLNIPVIMVDGTLNQDRRRATGTWASCWGCRTGPSSWRNTPTKSSRRRPATAPSWRPPTGSHRLLR